MSAPPSVATCPPPVGRRPCPLRRPGSPQPAPEAHRTSTAAQIPRLLAAELRRPSPDWSPAQQLAGPPHLASPSSLYLAGGRHAPHRRRKRRPPPPGASPTSTAAGPGASRSDLPFRRSPEFLTAGVDLDLQICIVPTMNRAVPRSERCPAFLSVCHMFMFFPSAPCLF